MGRSLLKKRHGICKHEVEDRLWPVLAGRRLVCLLQHGQEAVLHYDVRTGQSLPQHSVFGTGLSSNIQNSVLDSAIKCY